MTASFNVLKDPWVPLSDGLCSYIDLMTGSHDGPEIVHQRDDVRFFTTMLLSALTQGLFGDEVPDAATLQLRLNQPLPRRQVLDRIKSVEKDFDLVGRHAFLQGPPRRSKKSDDDEVDSLIYDVAKHQLYRSPVDAAVCGVASAVPLLYASQAFARSGGTGYFPGVRGAPPVTTLIRLDSVRKSVWANILHGQSRALYGYGKDRKRPWQQGATDASEPVGLVEGLFWQPLGATASWIDTEGTCAATGEPIRRGVQFKRLGGRMRIGKVFFAHPCSPVVGEGQRAKFLHLRSGRPAWTGLGDLLPGLRDGTKRASRPAPVVEQWSELDQGDASLVVLEYVTKKASVTGRFVEVFPLSVAIKDTSLADHVTCRVQEAENALSALRVRIFPSKNRKAGAFRGRAAGRKKDSDITAMFWQRTEPLFWEWFHARVEGTDGRKVFRRGVGRAALAIFDDVTSVLDGSADGLARTARERANLVRDLREALTLGADRRSTDG